MEVERGRMFIIRKKAVTGEPSKIECFRWKAKDGEWGIRIRMLFLTKESHFLVHQL